MPIFWPNRSCSTASFTEQLDALKATDQRQQAAIDEFGTIRETLHRELESRERQLANLTEQRDQAPVAPERTLRGAGSTDNAERR